MKVGSKMGLFGSWYPTIDDKMHICSHWHRTSGGAKRCGDNQVRFLTKVEALKKQKELDNNTSLR